MYDFRLLTQLPTDALVFELSEVTSQLANLYEEIAMIEADEVREKAHVLTTSEETSSSGRRDRVSMTVVEKPASRIQLQGTRDALAEKKWLIVRILESR